MEHETLTKEDVERMAPGAIVAAHRAGLLDHLFTGVHFDEHEDWVVCDLPTYVADKTGE